MDESLLLARLQFLVGALRSLLRLTVTPARNAALNKRCQEVRAVLVEIEMEFAAPARFEDYYDFSQAEKTGEPE